VFGILNSKVRGRLLKKNLLLEKMDEICCFHEVMVLQMKVVGDVGLNVADAETVNDMSRMPKAGNRRRNRGSGNAGARGK